MTFGVWFFIGKPRQHFQRSPIDLESFTAWKCNEKKSSDGTNNSNPLNEAWATSAAPVIEQGAGRPEKSGINWGKETEEQ